MNQNDGEHKIDAAESAIKYAHIVIPCVGAVLIFLMAAIAITVA